MDPIIPVALKLLSEVMEFINTREANKWRDELTGIDLDILKEESKYPDCDDQKIVELKQKRGVIAQAAYSEWLSFKTKGQSK